MSMNHVNPFGAHLKIAALAIILGLVTIILAQAVANLYFLQINIGVTLANIGAFLAIAGFLNLIYERYAKVSFFKDIFIIMTGSKNISESGAIDFMRDSKSKSYGEMLKLCTSVTTVFSYSSRFLTDYHEQIDHMIKNGKSLTCIFLDKNSVIIKKMIKDGLNEQSIMGHYNNTENFAETHKDNKNVKIYFVDYIPRYSCIKFDSDLFVIANTNTQIRQTVPAIHIRPFSPLWDFYDKDINGMI